MPFNIVCLGVIIYDYTNGYVQIYAVRNIFIINTETGVTKFIKWM